MADVLDEYLNVWNRKPALRAGGVEKALRVRRNVDVEQRLPILWNERVQIGKRPMRGKKVMTDLMRGDKPLLQDVEVRLNPNLTRAKVDDPLELA